MPHAVGAVRRRAVTPPSPPILAAVLATEVTAANYGSVPSLVQRCVDDQPCLTDLVNPAETKVYQQTGQVMRIGPIDAGKINIESDGLTLPRTAFLRSTKIVPGAYDLNQFSQVILIISDHGGAVGLKSVGPNGTTQEVVTVPYNRGITRVDPSTVFGNIDPNFQFEITDSVGLVIEWRNRATGKVTRIPALRIEDAFSEAYVARITPSTTMMVKNALLVQPGGVNFWFFPAAGIDFPQFGRGALILPYGMISTTDIPTFTGSSGEGSLKITGAPEGQDLLPFFAWAITDGIAYPLTRFQQAATAHGTGLTFTPYQNAVWTGLRSDATHHTELTLQSMDSLPNTGTLTLDDQGKLFATHTVSLPGYSSQRINLDTLAGTHTLYNATFQMQDNPSTQYPNDTPRASGSAIVTASSGTNARAPVIVPRTATTAHYAMTTTIGVWDHGRLLQGSGTTTDLRLLQTITGVSDPANRVGGLWTNTNDSNWQALDEMLTRIHDEFSAPDYVSVFGDTQAALSPYLTDSDGDGTALDVGPVDWPYDNSSGAPGNQASGTMFINYTIIIAPQNVGVQEYVDHFLLPLQNTRAYLSSIEARCLLTATCGVRSYAADLAAIMQPGYSSSWPTPEALANQLTAWADGNDANGELFDATDPFSYNNMGSPVNVGFLLKPAGGGVPFNLSALQMASVFSAVRSFLIEYVTAHAESYGGTANGFSLSLDPTWSSQDSATPGVFELRTDISVVTSTGEQLFTTGTTRDERLMRILYNVPEIQDALLGNYVQDNNNPEFQVLQHTIERIRTNFSDADYRAVFDETQANLAPFFTDTDGDGYCIDILPNGQDWQYDNTTGSPGNNAQGTLRLQLHLTRATK
jgi:hypothetical protein